MRTAKRVTVEVLGPLLVRDEAGDDITPSGVLQRRLLALLVMRRGEVVSADAAIDALWPSEAPRDAAAALQNHISRLRRALPSGLVESVATGYRLDPSRVAVDADRLVHLLGDDGLDAGTGDELHDLLQRWRGPAYPELADAGETRAEVTTLEELRVRATEALAEARLATGDHDGLVSDLLALIDREPLRERPRALLMSALATAGRTAEALRVYDDFRRVLGAELGIAPSPSLDSQHAALLSGTTGSAERPVARSAEGRLPIAATSLVGRDDLLAGLLARAEDARVVTLVGPGGVGKTRLLIEMGHRLQAARPERPVVLCELAQGDARTVADAVASALGIDARPGVPPISRIVEVLGTDEAVVLLDNCEHVLDSAAELVERLVSGCPAVTVVATSRERLRVSGEHVSSISPLPTDDREAAAVDLFVQRARAVRSDFVPDDEDRERLVAVVRHLDGLPLAIELAAARLHTHGLDEIAAGLDRPLSLLTVGPRTSARHSSLEAVVSWSYEMLDDELQRSFASLSVFVGPFSESDAAAVCGLGPDATVDALARLVERSLIVRAPGRRFVMLETLRAFCIDRLTASGRSELVGRRHADRMVEWADDVDRRLSLPDTAVVAEIDEAIPELRAALDWLLDHQLVDEAARMVASLISYGLLRLRPDVLSWADRVIAADPDDLSPAASSVWAASAYTAWMAGDVPGAGVRSERAVALAERNLTRVSQVAATARGNFDLFEGRLTSAADWYRRAVEAANDPTQRMIARGTELLALGYAASPRADELAADLLREVGDVESAVISYAWYCAGEAVLTSDVDLAHTRLVRAIELAELTGASFVRGVAGASKASIEATAGDAQVAAADYRWLIAHWQRAGMWSTQWTMLRAIVGLLERLGRPRAAAVLEGAVRTTAEGHRIFGADELALQEIGDRLRADLGDDAYEAAVAEGAVLDGRAAAEHALASL